MKWYLIFLIFPAITFSQINIDSLITHQEDLQYGIVLKSIQDVDLFQGTQYIRILDIDLDKVKVSFDLLQFGNRSGPKYLSQTMKNLHYDAAINGSYFNRMGFPSAFVQKNSRIFSVIEHSGLAANYKDNGAWALTLDTHQPVILKKPFFGWRLMPEYEDILAAGPLLVYNGVRKIYSYFPPHGLSLPRSAIGITPDNHFIAVTIAGDKENIKGMTINQLSEFMQSLNCHSALNLGGTNVMWIKEKGGVVNLLYKNDHIPTRDRDQSLKFVEPANSNAIVMSWIIKP